VRTASTVVYREKEDEAVTVQWKCHTYRSVIMSYLLLHRLVLEPQDIVTGDAFVGNLTVM
jgi:hypothetical protein